MGEILFEVLEYVRCLLFSDLHTYNGLASCPCSFFRCSWVRSAASSVVTVGLSMDWKEAMERILLSATPAQSQDPGPCAWTATLVCPAPQGLALSLSSW